VPSPEIKLYLSGQRSDIQREKQVCLSLRYSPKKHLLPVERTSRTSHFRETAFPVGPPNLVGVEPPDPVTSPILLRAVQEMDADMKEEVGSLVTRQAVSKAVDHRDKKRG
jgi:hypothetical protein